MEKQKVLVISDRHGWSATFALIGDIGNLRFSDAHSVDEATRLLESEQPAFVLIDGDLGDNDATPEGLAGRFILQVLAPRGVRFANFSWGDGVAKALKGEFVAKKANLRDVIGELRVRLSA